MSHPNAVPDAEAIEEVYRQLTKGRGRERVNDGNVWALIRRAEQDGHTVLATELREWQAICVAPSPFDDPAARP